MKHKKCLDKIKLETQKGISNFFILVFGNMKNIDKFSASFFVDLI